MLMDQIVENTNVHRRKKKKKEKKKKCREKEDRLCFQT